MYGKGQSWDSSQGNKGQADPQSCTAPWRRIRRRERGKESLFQRNGKLATLCSQTPAPVRYLLGDLLTNEEFYVDS